MHNVGDDIPDFVAQLTVDVQDEDGSLLGFVAIDRVVRGSCSGGIRMAHDISRSEVRGLANAMSWKFAFMNLPAGGAKSGIVCPLDADKQEQQRRLALFGKKIAPLLRSFYAAGGDINVGPSELAIVKRGAGLPTRERPGTRRGGYFTAFGVCTTITAWLQEAGIENSAATAIIEGYGSIGQPLARGLQEAGVRVIGISTLAGGLLNPEGINLDALDALKQQHGDDCVAHYTDAAQLPGAELLLQKTTVLVPGARPWAIHQGNAPDLQCKAIIPASNIPVTPEAMSVLEKAGVVIVPEFVTNSGGTFGCALINRGFSDAAAKRLLQRVYSARLQGLLRRATAGNESVRRTAERIADENRERLNKQAGSKRAILTSIFERGNGFRRLWSRLALQLFTACYGWFGNRAARLPAALHAAAAEAVYSRAVSKSFDPE